MTESGEIPVTVTLKGYWNMKETPFCKVISADKKQTVLRFTCKDGASFEVEIEEKNIRSFDWPRENCCFRLLPAVPWLPLF